MPRGTANPNSISRLQANALSHNKLDLIGEDETNYKPVSLKGIEATLFDIAVEYVELARINLKLSDRISKGSLSDSIIPADVLISGKIFHIDISILEYYKFVDKGVKGWQSGGGNSPYQFKKPGGGHGAKASKFVTSIRKWIIREGLTQRAAEVGHPKSISRDSKRKAKSKFTDTSTRTAIVIAANIKRRGLEPTHFWSNTEAAMIKKIKSKFSLALKVDIINNITNGY